MNKRRLDLFVTSVAGKLWAIGGCGSEDDPSTIEVYDPEIDSWSESEQPKEFAKGCVTGCSYSSSYFQ